MSAPGKQIDIDNVANLTNAIGHPIRLRIVRILFSRKETSWTDLNNELEAELGHLNPNTLSFHLSKLILAGIAERKEDNRYALTSSKEKSALVKAVVTLVR
jgi:DNA-binding HxlR family transcriptional regulator